MKRIGCGVGVREGGFSLVPLPLVPLVPLLLVPLLLGGPAEMVVVRMLALPSSLSIREGGGGRGERTEARQRKHSPVPKYLGAGRG